MSSFSSKMLQPQPQRTSSSGSDADAIRKRVCKACDRCRLKKSKCDGASPCSRCTADNAICVFGERKKSHDKIYPKGYVEMLEQQQSQLVQGLQEMYHRMLAANMWDGPTLSEATGHPLTHDILAAMGLLEKKHDSDETIAFEDDVEKLQARLIADGAVMTKRRGSVSSESDSQSIHRAHSSSHSTPVLSKPTLFKENFSFNSSRAPTSSPTSRSPAPKKRKTYPPAVQSPLHQNPPMTNNDPQLYQAEWTLGGQTFADPESIMKTSFALGKAPYLQQQQQPAYDFSQDALIDSPMTSEFDFSDLGYSHLGGNGFGGGPMQDFGYGAYDPMMDVDFKSFIATA